MRSWWRTLWSSVRDSLWFLPAVMTLAAALLAVALMAAERQGLFGPTEGVWWLYQANAEAARSVLSAITASLITVTGVVFSVTIVAVQLASSQYTPRVLRDFSSDRGNQLVLGIFIGTFTYAVLVLRTVGGSPGDDEFVPRLAVTIAVGLLILSVVALIYFIHHLARELHVTAILDRVALRTLRNVRQLFPQHIGSAAEAHGSQQREPEGPIVYASEAGYIQAVDEKALFALGKRARLVIWMEPKIGDYVLGGRPLATVSGDVRLDRELEDGIRKAFVLGPERTPDQDVEFGMVQISDIAVKALSPSINDPTTAIRCIDRLSEILAELGRRDPPEPRRTRDGIVHFVASYTTFEQAVKVAYDEIRHFGASVPLIAEHLLGVLEDLCTLVPEGRRDPLLKQARGVLHTARTSIDNPMDVKAVEVAAEWLPIAR